MQRVTISLDAAIAAEFDALIVARGYHSRSEAIRDLIRQAVDARRLESAVGRQCVASLSYVYDRRTRSIAERLLELQHRHHDLVAAATHIILDHRSTLETMILKGPTGAVRALSDTIRAERGVRFGAINLISVEPNDAHAVGDAHHHHDKAHRSPLAG